MNRILPAAIVAICFAVSGCADTPQADADYGRSVQQMVKSQTYDPGAASNPPELAPEVGDGARLKNALDAYRKDVAKGSAAVKAPIEFEVGGGQ